MRRGDFEDLVRRHLDAELNPRGFRLIPQPPADWDDEKPAVVYEANPNDFGERYPTVVGGALGNAPCVDLWIRFDPTTGLITSELEWLSLEELLARFRVEAPALTESSVDIDTQLHRLARRYAAILDAASRV